MNYIYLMDSNVVATSEVMSLIETDFFRRHCLILNEIAYELSGTTIAAELQVRAVAPSVQTLKHLRTIVNDLVQLSILRTDHGNGEALLLAEALAIREVADGQVVMDFMKSEPIIVTNERAVDTYAKSLGIQSISGREFMDVFKAATSGVA